MCYFNKNMSFLPDQLIFYPLSFIVETMFSENFKVAIGLAVK